MSYTIFCKEVNKWLKANDLPLQGTKDDSKQETQLRLSAWQTGTKYIFNQWLKEEMQLQLLM